MKNTSNEPVAILRDDIRSTLKELGAVNSLQQERVMLSLILGHMRGKTYHLDLHQVRHEDFAICQWISELLKSVKEETELLQNSPVKIGHAVVREPEPQLASVD